MEPEAQEPSARQVLGAGLAVLLAIVVALAIAYILLYLGGWAAALIEDITTSGYRSYG